MRPGRKRADRQTRTWICLKPLKSNLRFVDQNQTAEIFAPTLTFRPT